MERSRVSRVWGERVKRGERDRGGSGSRGERRRKCEKEGARKEYKGRGEGGGEGSVSRLQGIPWHTGGVGPIFLRV